MFFDKSLVFSTFLHTLVATFLLDFSFTCRHFSVLTLLLVYSYGFSLAFLTFLYTLAHFFRCSSSRCYVRTVKSSLLYTSFTLTCIRYETSLLDVSTYVITFICKFSTFLYTLYVCTPYAYGIRGSGLGD